MNPPTAPALDAQVIMLGPLSLPPQGKVHLILMLVMAAILQIAPSGWGPINNGSDGTNATVARELALGVRPAEIQQAWFQPSHSTAAQWITAQSFRVFNVNEFAARLPFALANLLIVGLVFLIGENLGGFWRGLSSGLLAATMIGPILYGRDGGGGALTALLLMTSIYCGVRILGQKSAFKWQLFFWLAIAGLMVSGHPGAAVLGVLGIWVPFIAFREARIRMRLPWWLIFNGVFVAVFVGYFFNPPLLGPEVGMANVSRLVGILFPWSVIILPILFCGLRKVIRFWEITPAEYLLWSSFFFSSIWIICFRSHEIWAASSACACPIFALVSALTWERTGSRVRIFGVSLLVLLALGAAAFTRQFINLEWIKLLYPICWLSSSVFVIFCISAVVALYHHHSRTALLTIAAATIPLSFNLLDANARYSWEWTFRDMGRNIAVNYMPGNRVFLDEPPEEVSSLLYYAPLGLAIQPYTQAALKPGDFILLENRREKDLGMAKRIGSNRTHNLFWLPQN